MQRNESARCGMGCTNCLNSVRTGPPQTTEDAATPSLSQRRFSQGVSNCSQQDSSNPSIFRGLQEGSLPTAKDNEDAERFLQKLTDCKNRLCWRSASIARKTLLTLALSPERDYDCLGLAYPCLGLTYSNPSGKARGAVLPELPIAIQRLGDVHAESIGQQVARLDTLAWYRLPGRVCAMGCIRNDACPIVARASADRGLFRPATIRDEQPGDCFTR